MRTKNVSIIIIIARDFMSFAFEKTLTKLGCKLVSVFCQEYENGLFAMQQCCETLNFTRR